MLLFSLLILLNNQSNLTQPPARIIQDSPHQDQTITVLDRTVEDLDQELAESQDRRNHLDDSIAQVTEGLDSAASNLNNLEEMLDGLESCFADLLEDLRS